MKCESCGGETSSRKVRKHHWHEGRLYIVESIEAEVCRECGERYYRARVLDSVDALIRREHEVKQVLSVEVLTV